MSTDINEQMIGPLSHYTTSTGNLIVIQSEPIFYLKVSLDKEAPSFCLTFTTFDRDTPHRGTLLRTLYYLLHCKGFLYGPNPGHFLDLFYFLGAWVQLIG